MGKDQIVSENQDSLFDKALEQEIEENKNQPVTCLGITFENEESRRNYFLGQLKEKLKDPEFRKIEGFPIGTDEAILELSDPPYYTACPNPWVADFVKEWENEKPLQNEPYHREPFAADISEGKNHPIYNAHSYHTKVPHKAIMRYILHYTNPGDIVYDGFCGTGMTGVAANMCGDRNAIAELGYQIKPDGVILDNVLDDRGVPVWKEFSKLGKRNVILNDLSPVATFIASNYNKSINIIEFEKEIHNIFKLVEQEYGWMYQTHHTDNNSMGLINYTVWSDVFICPECTGEVVFWEAAVNKQSHEISEEFPCPKCSANLTKRKMERAWVTKYDYVLKELVRFSKQIPVLINYTVDRSRYEKRPDSKDIDLIEKIESIDISNWVPQNRMIEGTETRRNDPIGLKYVHQFYTKRNLVILASIRRNCKSALTLLLFNSQLVNLSKLNRYRPGISFPYNPLSGTLYIGSQISEANVFTAYYNKAKRLILAFKSVENNAVISTQSSTVIDDIQVDYIFIDPPFGSNLNYSELSFFWEAWLKVLTKNEFEAIENRSQNKDLNDYRHLMRLCFIQAYRILKPGRWMTVEFSNTKASVWNSIQTALNDAGFIISNISTLDKQMGTFKSVTTPTAVKQDLIISAYKPNGGFEDRFDEEVTTEEGVWDFVRTHLGYLPVVKQQDSTLQAIPERDPRILFDQMVAYYIRKGYDVPLSSQEFQIGLAHRFIERDGMCFLQEQAAEYDRKKMLAGEIGQLSIFVSDETTAIQWLRELLRSKPQIFSDINPQFMQQLGGWNKKEKPLDLRDILYQNFLCFDGKDRVPEQIHTYLSSNWKEYRNLPKDDPTLLAKAKDRWYVPDPNKQADLDKLREKTLLKEFWEYLPAGYKMETVDNSAPYLPALEPKSKSTAIGRKLKVMRIEALRAGFKYCWQNKDYKTIIAVANRIPEDVLQEDPKLLMWYDQAKTRLGED